MTLYQKMQLSPAVLRQHIRESFAQEKKQYVTALVLRSVLLLLFAIAYISIFTIFFGQKNSYVGVGSLCMLLSIRFVNYGYHIIDSLVALFFISSLYLINSFFLAGLPVILYFVVQLASLSFILLMTTTHPEYGNGGVYAFSYILITSNTVSGQHEILQRTGAVYLSFLFCGLVFLQKHSQANRTIRFHHICKGYSLHQTTYQWQLRLALGIAFALSIGKYLGIPRSMWMGFASMSLLLPQTHQVLSRGFSRMMGVTIGSVIFVLCLHLFPIEWVFLLGPLAGFCLGLTPHYGWASILNCFGALSAAYVLLGILPAGVIRIQNNFLGILCGLGIALLFQLLQRKSTKRVGESQC
ncbi:FUSC family protein [Enterococcus asini]|uniref:FUSC family protein n=1 Tax=Enterococcus asini TaxID=57732 RepID=UPI0028923A26|nr:FUSC family protein [Enterococcus asini]MDT2784176.1 FUSC family protein [Enterococcus asini]